MDIQTVVYEAVDATKPSDRFMAYIIQGADGQNVLLPIYFREQTAEGARNRAIAFWNDEKAKKAALAERGRKLGLSRRKDGALATVKIGSRTLIVVESVKKFVSNSIVGASVNES